MTRRKTGSGIRMKERLQKLLSAAGVCSRRAAEGYITAGRVTVNGETALLGQQADPETDDIRVDGVPLGREPEAVYLMLNKPRGYVTTVSDEQGRKTVMDLLTGVSTRVYPVGRLDSEGLLLLTNDGALTHRLLHPSHEVSKEYRVTVSGPVEHAAERLSRIRDVVGLPIRPAEVRELSRKGNRAELSVTIHEGRSSIFCSRSRPVQWRKWFFTKDATARSGGCAPSAGWRSCGSSGCGSIVWSLGRCRWGSGGT